MIFAPSGAGARKLVFELDGRRAPAFGEIEHRRDRAQRVGERHDRAAMEHGGPGAELFANNEFRRHPLRRSAGEMDPEQRREGQWVLAQTIQRVHETPPGLKLGSNADSRRARKWRRRYGGYGLCKRRRRSARRRAKQSRARRAAIPLIRPPCAAKRGARGGSSRCRSRSSPSRENRALHWRP